MLSKRLYAAATAVVGLVGATVVAAPRASADISYMPPLPPYAAFYQSTTGQMLGYASNYGLFNSNGAMAPGTSPSTAPTPASIQMVWHGANGDLWSSGPTGAFDTGLAMAPGTSPSLLTFPDGNWIALVVDTGGELQSTGSWGTSAPLGASTAVAPGTSPSIAAIPLPKGPRGAGPDNFTYAWQGTNNHLWLFTGDLPFDTGYAMAPGTSPSMYSYPYITGGYIAAFQNNGGDLAWVDNAGSTNTGLVMAPGTSPSTVDPGSDSDVPAIAVQGSNGDLWTTGTDSVFSANPTGYDTGLPMMAGSSPSMIVSPTDQAGRPHSSLPFFAGYASNTGAVSIYGTESTGSSTAVLTETTGQIVAPGTSPSIVSTLNSVDGKQVVFAGETGANWQQFFTSSTTGAASDTTDTAAAPVTLPSKPTIAPMLEQQTASDTCSTVLAHREQFAAQNIKQVMCQTTAPATALDSAQSTKTAATPDSAAAGSCNPGQWTISRGEECAQAVVNLWDVINLDTFQVVGTLTFLDNQDILLSNYSSLFTENDTYSLIGETGDAVGYPVTVSFTANCSAPCSIAGTPPPSTFTLAENTSKSFSYTFQDSPLASKPDTFNLNYLFNATLPMPPFAPSTGPSNWSAPQPIRCDSNTPNYTSAGCVVPTYTPTVVLPLSVYGAAAMNAYVGELYLPGTPGLSSATPLTRGDPANTDPNRAQICTGFTALPAGNLYGVVKDSCDEYPFASSQQSGAAFGVAGQNCLEIVPTQNANGIWTFKFRNMYTASYPQVCLRGHVNNDQNTSVGGALQSMYVGNRMMIGDPYTVQVTN